MLKNRNPVLGALSAILIIAVVTSLFTGVAFSRNGTVLRAEDPAEYWAFLFFYSVIAATGIAAFLLLTNEDIAKDLDDRDTR